MNDDKQVNENQREEMKDEIFRKEQEIEEEISHLKTELKGYKKPFINWIARAAASFAFG